ncbi:hypothetical protein Gotur_027980 [Gossypium turneri]
MLRNLSSFYYKVLGLLFCVCLFVGTLAAFSNQICKQSKEKSKQKRKTSRTTKRNLNAQQNL